MKTFIPFAVLLCFISSAVAQDEGHQTLVTELKAEKVLHTYDWEDLMSKHPFPNGEIISTNGMTLLKIENTNNAPLKISVLKITNSIVRKMDSLSLEMKYENVSRGYGDNLVFQNDSRQDIFSGEDPVFTGPPADLQLTTHFPPNVSGADVITNRSWIPFGGTVNWKRYTFFTAHGNEHPLNSAELFVQLPGPGTVYIRQVRILQVAQNWWAPAFGAIIGGVGGTLLGCFGAVIGCLTAMGKARRFVLVMTKCFIALGIILTVAGIAAVVCRQSYAIYYPLILLGGVLTFVFSVNFYPIKRRYDDLEIRRMASMDATGR